MRRASTHVARSLLLLLLSLHLRISSNFKSAFQMCPPTFYVCRTIRFPRILATDLQPIIIETTYNTKYLTLLLRRKQRHLQRIIIYCYVWIVKLYLKGKTQSQRANHGHASQTQAALHATCLFLWPISNKTGFWLKSSQLGSRNFIKMVSKKVAVLC